MTQPHAALRRSRVLVVGIGGLGNPAALALVRAGVGHLGLVDSDDVDLSNLPRQILFRDDDIGRPKVVAAAARLLEVAPDVRIDVHHAHLGADGQSAAAALLAAHDFVIDATDSIESKFFLNDLAVAVGRPLAHAGVTGERGQLLTILPGQGPCLRCLFPDTPADDDTPGCSAAGVLGPLVGAFGTLQAGEAIKYLGATGTPFRDRMLVCDRGRWRTLGVRRDPDCSTCGATGTSRFEPRNS